MVNGKAADGGCKLASAAYSVLNLSDALFRGR